MKILNCASLLLLVTYAPEIFAELNYQSVGSWVYNGLAVKSDIKIEYDRGIKECKQLCEKDSLCMGIEYSSALNGWKANGMWVYNRCDIHYDNYQSCDKNKGGRGSDADGCWVKNKEPNYTKPGLVEIYKPHEARVLKQQNLLLPGSTNENMIHYELVGKVAVLEGDIVLGREDELSQFTIEGRRKSKNKRVNSPMERNDKNDDVSSINSALTASNRFDRLWPGGVVPYIFDNNISTDERRIIMRGISHVDTRTTLTLVPRTAEVNYIKFTKNSYMSCHSSSIGMNSGEQEISLDIGNGCGNMGVVAHEILHAIGIYHEQSRRDRDSFIQVLWQNILETKRNQYFQHLDDSMDIGDYDFNSIMHYPAISSFSINRQLTFMPINPMIDVNSIGQRNGLSTSDITGVNRLYSRASSMPPLINGDRIITVNIDRLRGLTQDCWGYDNDFYGHIEIGSGVDWTSNDQNVSRRRFPAISSNNNPTVNWNLSASVPTGIDNTKARVTIDIFDRDIIGCGGANGDDDIDVNPRSGKKQLDLIIDLVTGEIAHREPDPDNPETFVMGSSVGMVGEQITPFPGYEGDDHGQITFTITAR